MVDRIRRIQIEYDKVFNIKVTHKSDAHIVFFSGDSHQDTRVITAGEFNLVVAVISPHDKGYDVMALDGICFRIQPCGRISADRKIGIRRNQVNGLLEEKESDDHN